MKEGTVSKRINWEAASVILAMLLFAANIFYTNYKDDLKSETEKNNIRTMFAYEIASNHRKLAFLDHARLIGFDKNAERMTGEPFALSLKSLGGIRLDFASDQSDKMYKAYFRQMSTLDKDDVTLLMDYYAELHTLMKEIDKARRVLKSKDTTELELEGNTLETHFLNEMNLSNILLKKYQNLLPSHPKAPEKRNFEE
ncbi:lysogenic conversion protein [Candidatus Pantoea formicae]|uniref:lysogenic conversion protein n=1 Tax=Candidatus Pantoea formicae TaxID=2608355 RepID=UPI003ED9EDA1